MPRFKGSRLIKDFKILILAVMPVLWGCQPGSQLTEYQAPAFLLRAFHKDHPNAESVTYRQMTKDGVRVYLVDFMEMDEGSEVEKEAWYNAQGKPFVSRASKRLAEQEQQRLAEEREAKAKEELDDKEAKDENQGNAEKASQAAPVSK